MEALILETLRDGPVEGQESYYFKAFNLILSMTDNADSKEFFSEDLVKTILEYRCENLPYKGIIYKILINIFSDESLNAKFSKCHGIMNDIMDISLDDICKVTKFADYSCMLLANISRSEDNCLHILSFLDPLLCHLQGMILVFSLENVKSTSLLHYLSMVLWNLSQLDEVRKVLTKTDNSLLQKLAPFMSHENPVCRKGIIGLIHNCSFDSSIHNWLISEEVDILPRLLLPLAGPEEFDDDDNDKLPIDLQYLPNNKTRDPDPEIRKLLLKTLNKLCTTKPGRQYLRDHNTYVILRELHKWEKDPLVLLACENVVDILIKTEEEIGIDDLNTVEIPTDLEEKFNKNLTLN